MTPPNCFMIEALQFLILHGRCEGQDLVTLGSYCGTQLNSFTNGSTPIFKTSNRLNTERVGFATSCCSGNRVPYFRALQPRRGITAAVHVSKLALDGYSPTPRLCNTALAILARLQDLRRTAVSFIFDVALEP